MTEKWKEKNVLKIKDDRDVRLIDTPENDDAIKEHRKEIEPWLTALFQSEHFSLLMGTGISIAAHFLATGKPGAGMDKIKFGEFSGQLDAYVKESAQKLGRGDGNIEDQIRIANDLIQGLTIYTKTDIYGAKKLRKKIKKFYEQYCEGLAQFVHNILSAERNIVFSKNTDAAEYLMNYLVSFASRSGVRERLNIFTTNYDRTIEFAAELAGIRLIDRFVGSINPIFHSSRLEIDMHYNPPGIRGEPRYLEGVVHFTKLHGSIDWIYENENVRRIALPYGADAIKKYLPLNSNEEADIRSLLVYPNSSKERETSEYPYVELFRDFASAVCRPNSTLVAYGYGFGDEHINRVIRDMLGIPSTHLVIISFNDECGRIQKFYDDVKRHAQITLLMGKHFGDLKTLVNNYLPKPAIDRTTFKMAELLKARGWLSSGTNQPEVKPEDDL